MDKGHQLPLVIPWDLNLIHLIKQTQ